MVRTRPSRQVLIEALEDRTLMTRALGIDVSHYQGVINWTAVHASGKADFAIAKATEGTTYTDPTFATNMTNAKAAGVLIGAYHYARYDNNTAADEAAHFLAVAGPYLTSGYMVPVLDVEQATTLSKTQVTEWVNDWCAIVRAATGVTPVVYSYTSYANNYIDSTASQWPLWMASYNGRNVQTSAPSTTAAWPTWTYWQNSSTGTVAGISGAVDTDVFNGTLADLTANYSFAAPSTPQVLVMNPDRVIASSGSAVDFGTVGQIATVPLTFTITNTGPQAMTLANLTVPAGYAIVDGLAASLNPGDSDTVTVRANTLTKGAQAGTVTFDTNDPKEPTYTIKVAGNVVAPIGGAVYGIVFSDINGNGNRDTGDVVIPGRTVYVDLNNNGIPDGADPVSITDSNGLYSFTGLTAGQYVIREVGTAGWRQTLPATASEGIKVAVKNNEFVACKGFGQQQLATISGLIFNDANGNRKQDLNELGRAGVVVYVDANRNGKLDAGERTSTTDANGLWSFDNVLAGRVSVRVATTPGLSVTTAGAGVLDITVPYGAAAITNQLFGVKQII